VAKSGEAGEEEEQSPTGRQVWVFHLAATQTPDQIDEADDHGGIERDSEKGVGESAMMSEAERRTSEAAEDVEIGRFGSQRQHGRGQRGLAVEAGSAHTCAGKKMGNGFHGSGGFYVDAGVNANLE
jgi:hypothetical protein